jgi:anaerobic selenocysteine-containing dehydrogenase
MSKQTLSIDVAQTKRIHGWCALCRSRCGCVSVVQDGRLTAVERDPDHPTGSALCAKGQAAPELVYSPDRLLYPMKRTRPKGDADPGWVRISWDEALDTTAAHMQRLAAEHGPRSVAFAITTPSGTSISDSIHWVERLMRAYGSPNNCYGTEICNWHKDHASAFTYGHGIGVPDLERTSCVLLWGHNPNASWLAQAQRVAAVKARGGKVVVIDPRRAGPAIKADEWVRVRPGTDGALALGFANIAISEGWYDEAFLKYETNAPFLVRSDTNMLLTEADVRADGDADRFMLLNSSGDAVSVESEGATPGAQTIVLRGSSTIHGLHGDIACATVFERYAQRCAEYPASRVETITGVGSDQLHSVANMLWANRPVSYYAWSGVGQHTNATQTDRGISCLYTLMGSLGSAGGNVQFPGVSVNDVSGREFVGESQAAETLGLAARPLGPARDGWCTSSDLYGAILDEQPYAVKALLGFGANPLISHASTARGMDALAKLEFHVQADMFITPTAEYADLLLPINTPWEREALRTGFEISERANTFVQLRQPAVESLGESRDDGFIAFELAKRLGLAAQFWDGDRDAGLREWLEPSGFTLEQLRASPTGLTGEAKSRSTAEPKARRKTSTGRIEIWSSLFSAHGYEPLPNYVPPMATTRYDRGVYPFILGSSKPHLFCHGQFRNLPKLRRRMRDPRVELHSESGRRHGIEDGDWLLVRTPTGVFRGRALFNENLAGDLVLAQHGWWQACTELGLEGYPTLGIESANMNSAVSDDDCDPISGSVGHRSHVCRIEPLNSEERTRT